MKKAFIGVILFFYVGLVNGQQIVINDKLLIQMTVNHGVRIGSEQAFLSSYEKQKALYDDIKNKTAQVIAIQEYIYKMSTRHLRKAKNYYTCTSIWVK